MSARVLLLIIVLILVFPPQHVWAQTLEQALTELLAAHPRIQGARKGLADAAARIDEAFADFLPRVELTGDRGYEYTDSPGRRKDKKDPLSTTDREKATVTVSQLLFDGRRRDGVLDIAELNQDIANFELDSTTQEVLFEGIDAYHEVLRQSRLVDLGRGNEATIKHQLELEDERVRTGAGIAVDVLLSKARLQIAKEQRVSFQGQLRAAITRYRQVFDTVPQIAELIEPIPPIDLLPDTVDEAAKFAIEENPELSTSTGLVDVASRERTVAQSDFWPRLELVGKANAEDDVDGIVGSRYDFSVLLQLNWEIFSGFATRARVAQASAQYGERLDELSFTRRKVTEEVGLAWNNLLTARERVELLQNAVSLANQVFDARKKLRDAGKESTLNVLDAETEYYNARINFVNASYDARVAVYRLLLAMGSLTAQALKLNYAGATKAD